MSEHRFTLDRRKRLAANQRFDLYFDRIVGPQGVAVDDFLIVKPRTLIDDKVGGVVTLPVRGSEVGLMQGYRHQFDYVVWQAPSGFVEPDESAQMTARRELEEETSLTCAADELIDLGVMMPDAGLIEARVALFAALNCRPLAGATAVEPGAGRLVWMPLDEAKALALSGRNIGASTIIAIFRYAESAGRLRL